MKASVLKDKSFSFAVRIVNFVRWIQDEKKEYVLSKQVLRSGTAIGALISEAVFAQSRADFISKMSIALKEANETHYWLMLLKETDFLRIEQHQELIMDVSILKGMLINSIKTAKKNASR